MINITQAQTDKATKERSSEKPKLTRREREFLEAFESNNAYTIMRGFGGVLRVTPQYSPVELYLKSEMFPFIENAQVMTFTELFELEVEEEE